MAGNPYPDEWAEVIAPGALDAHLPASLPVRGIDGEIIEGAVAEVIRDDTGLQGIGFEGSTNWSASGEGTGIRIDPKAKPAPGFKAQNNTLLVSVNPVFLARFSARLDVEHLTGLAQRAKSAAGATGA